MKKTKMNGSGRIKEDRQTDSVSQFSHGLGKTETQRALGLNKKRWRKSTTV